VVSFYPISVTNEHPTKVYLIDLYKWANNRSFRPPLNFLPWMRSALYNGQTIIIRRTADRTSVIGVHTSPITNLLTPNA
jgi:hypothetical protein